LGRPLALATFALQAGAWPDDPAAMLQVNFAIHLAAVGACFMLATGLARLRLPGTSAAPGWIGLGVAALWGLSPFLATTHLMILQRMTGLAGFLVLTGLAAFVWAHLLRDSHPRLSRAGLILGLGVGTTLAAFTKENGALLPLLALVILWLWIPKARRLTNRVDRALIVLLAVLPSALLLGYLASLLPGTLEYGYGPARYFTPVERLLSQLTIVLDYLHRLLLPTADHVSPYMDRLPAAKGWLDPPVTLVAAGCWAALIALAILLRRSAPYLLFGLSFYLAGQVFESGFINLELYFAHRNYVPSFGVYFALVFAVASAPIPYRRLAVFGLSVYTILFGLVLYQVTTTWNQLQLAGETWVANNPYSERGAQFLSSVYIAQGDYPAAQRVIEAAAQRNPLVPLLQIQRTMICVGQEAQFPELLREVLERLPLALYEPEATSELTRVARGDPSMGCAKRDFAALAAMADALLTNPPYAAEPITKSNLFLTKAFASAAANQGEEAIAFAMESYRLNRTPDSAFFTASIIAKTGQTERARQFLDEVRQSAPKDPRQRAAWLQRLDAFSTAELKDTAPAP
ncbi:MAG TPA: tetratricopeptide repeat protein, partial [Lamprocystis sp. (in: g-proteobacteria)]|nr:tetratricopeptide repeat protein [Lamprocystis sp. (in: g-proteobacteria)]